MVVTLLNRKHIAANLQDVEKAVHGIAIKEELKKWTLYSIRVGSCIFLSKGSYDGPFVKNHLYWKSDTFLLYLCNTACMAVQHSATIP